MRSFKPLLIGLVFALCACQSGQRDDKLSVSGIYPHLAFYNDEGECGTGAIVPWSGSLWAVTYGPHLPFGSSDKLYEITSGLELKVFEGSTGGTHANRMIHKESGQLFIGAYAIDKDKNVRVIPHEDMPGRHTGNARHLLEPKNKIYYGTMEEGFYEVDVNTLEVTLLYEDLNVTNRRKSDESSNIPLAMLKGVHGKGLYSGQGVMVYSNNGEAGRVAQQKFDVEAGSLSEWDGQEWKLVRRNQFVEVTGPGGIYGNDNPATDPIWATGWDHKSLILGVRNPETGWDFFRLPKASHTYDGAHGWNTEWPRIRNIADSKNPDYLMTMHGMFWRFPSYFTAGNSVGIRPRSAYLKVIGDFTRWNDMLVFGCDDSAQNEFLNKRKHKGGIGGPGQSNSNLWFTSLETPDQLGPATVSGSVWLDEQVAAGEVSEPMLFAGWENRVAWIANQGSTNTTFVLEIDEAGNQQWKELQSITVPAGESINVDFGKNDPGEWIRLRVESATTATVNFNYTDSDTRSSSPSSMFNGIAKVSDKNSLGGLLYGLGDNRRALGLSSVKYQAGEKVETGYYELDEALNLVKKEEEETNAFIKKQFAIPENVIDIEESSILIIDDKERRWRLPLGDPGYRVLTNEGKLRICREVATERDLFHAAGTFYELPAENADGFAKIRPISSHNFSIHDYASYRGLLVMTGIDPGAKAGEHIVRSDDGEAAVWVGAIDDLWKLGKPVGKGGPWKDEAVKANVPSDPYLIGFYNNRSLEISHKEAFPVTFRIEVEPIGHGPWMLYSEVKVEPEETYQYIFPDNFQARWIRFVADNNCVATTWLEYK